MPEPEHAQHGAVCTCVPRRRRCAGRIGSTFPHRRHAFTDTKKLGRDQFAQHCMSAMPAPSSRRPDNTAQAFPARCSAGSEVAVLTLRSAADVKAAEQAAARQ
jgi:hypothetical protein